MDEAIREEQEKVIGHLAMMGFDAARLLYYMDFFAGEPAVLVAQRRYDKRSFGLYQLRLDRREDGLCVPRGYRLRVIPYPQLHYDKGAGTGIRKLEKRILAIDWDQARLSAAGSAGDPRIARIFEQLHRLSEQGTEESARQARLLKEHFIYPDHQERLAAGDRFWDIRGDGSDFHMQEAFNLARGRAVFKPVPLRETDQGLQGQWNRLRDGELLTFPDYPTAEELRRMGIVEMDSGEGRLLLGDLALGEQVMANLRRGCSIQPVRLEADPENRGFKCYDLSGNRLDAVLKSTQKNGKRKKGLGR